MRLLGVHAPIVCEPHAHLVSDRHVMRELSARNSTTHRTVYGMAHLFAEKMKNSRESFKTILSKSRCTCRGKQLETAQQRAPKTAFQRPSTPRISTRMCPVASGQRENERVPSGEMCGGTWKSAKFDTSWIQKDSCWLRQKIFASRSGHGGGRRQLVQSSFGCLVRMCADKVRRGGVGMSSQVPAREGVNEGFRV
eukprot:2654383-Rhodomonas_salina.1